MPTDSKRHGEILGRAARAFELAMELDDSSEEAVIGFADTNVDMMLIDPAIAALREFVGRHHGSARVQAILGRLLFSTRQREAATAHLKFAFEQHPTLPFVAGDLGFIALSGGPR